MLKVTIDIIFDVADEGTHTVPDYYLTEVAAEAARALRKELPEEQREAMHSVVVSKTNVGIAA